jgi:hypothetical protein
MRGQSSWYPVNPPSITLSYDGFIERGVHGGPDRDKKSRQLNPHKHRAVDQSTEKLVPQPQEDVAFGFFTAK